MPTQLSSVNFFMVYKKWQQLAQSFNCFVHTTSFATLKTYPDFPLTEISGQPSQLSLSIAELVRAVGAGCEKPAAYFMDMPIAEGLNAACWLNRTSGLLPVLTIRHLNHPHGLIGSQGDISALIGYADTMQGCEPAGYLFLLDSARYADFDEKQYKTHFNNQYELTEYDLPPAEMLKESGLNHAVFLFKTKLKEDISEYKSYLQNSGVAVSGYDVTAADSPPLLAGRE